MKTQSDMEAWKVEASVREDRQVTETGRYCPSGLGGQIIKADEGKGSNWIHGGKAEDG